MGKKELGAKKKKRKNKKRMTEFPYRPCRKAANRRIEGGRNRKERKKREPRPTERTPHNSIPTGGAKRRGGKKEEEGSVSTILTHAF